MSGFRGNDNFYGTAAAADMGTMKNKVKQDIEQLLTDLNIAWGEDPNMRDTPDRVARMLLKVSEGRYLKRPDMTSFPNEKQIDQLYCVGPIDVRSMCSHHLVPIIGKAWIGIITSTEPDSRILGLSKFARLANWVFARPQIQEEATKQLADEIAEICKPSGLAVVVRATHLCTAWRGIKEEQAKMVTSEMRGVIREKPEVRNEFLQMIRGMGY